MASKVNRVHKTARGSLSFKDIGWSAIAGAALVVAWFLMNYRQFPVSYGGLIQMILGVILAASLACIMIGVWKASFRWKLLSVAIALVWLVPFTLYVMSFAGPLFYIHFTW